MNNILVDNTTLLQHIKELLSNGKRGTLFITTNHNQSITLAFENGVVTGIYSRGGVLRGEKALEHLIKIERASYKFDDSVMVVLPGGTPPPDDVSRILNNSVKKCSTDFYKRVMQVLEEHLKEAIGPYAIIVMSEFGEFMSDELDTIEKAEAVLHKLAEEIDSPSQSRIFIQSALQDLTTLYTSVI